MSSAAMQWLQPLRTVFDPGEDSWARLEGFAEALDRSLLRNPVGADVAAGAERSARLAAIRQELARGGWHPRDGDEALMMQFLCGYRDLDLRDAVGLGHGRLIAEHGSPALRQQWLPRLSSGELAGIAATEEHGGSRVAATRTYAERHRDGTWRVSGRKVWISRLAEASVFTVFVRAPDGGLSAVAVEADAPGLQREALTPAGLSGWSWGVLSFDAVPIDPNRQVLAGEGMELLREHFAGYRPLVVATALGAAAAVFDLVVTELGQRRACGHLDRLRDSALITLGREHMRVSTALLGVAVASRLSTHGETGAETWGCATKSHGIDTAHHAVAELAPLIGARGFCADSRLSKTRADLTGLLYADGIHDSLYRTAGTHHLTQCTAPPSQVPYPRSVSTTPPG